MKSKVILIAFLASLPVWLGVNFLENYLEKVFLDIELAKRPEVFINDFVEERKLAELKLDNQISRQLKELNIDALAAVSVKIDKQGNEKVLFEQNSEKKLAIASLTKLMTALVVFDSYDYFQLIPINEEAVSQDGDTGELELGEKLSVNSLVRTALIESSNDAAFALTQPLGEKTFVSLMNDYSEKIGLNNTYFNNPTGLEPDNYSTAKDLVKLTAYILKEKSEIFDITANDSYKILKPNGDLHHYIAQSTNKLLREVPGIIGGKTGWSPNAGGCLLLVLDDPLSSSYYINIVLGADDRFGEMKKIVDVIQSF